MRKFVIASVLAVAAAGTALAQGSAIEQRQALFKEMGKATGPVGAMLQGKAPFDAAPVKAALALYADHAVKLKDLFPADSKEGKTEALPAIWEKNAEFLAIFDKLKADSDAAAAAITDEATFKAEMGKVLGNCGACHDSFRVKKS
jgi:cytochrome c556